MLLSSGEQDMNVKVLQLIFPEGIEVTILYLHMYVHISELV